MDIQNLHDQLDHPGSEDDVMESSAFSHDKRLNILLQHIVDEIKLYAEDKIELIKRLSNIGLALSAEKNLDKLLELIVDEARSFTRADAGTLYLIDEREQCLLFEILQNDSFKIRMGGTSGNPITLPPIPLTLDGKPNYSNVSSYSVLTGRVVNIPDVYKTSLFDFTGPKKYDAATGYRSKSMLVIPMKNHENCIIGVLQLLNALDPVTGEVLAFSDEYTDLIGCLASQAAVALDNAQLIQSLKDLFNSFIRSIATAIDMKSPYTGGHIRRVVDLTTTIAKRINALDNGAFADIRFTEEEIEELRMAAWMHDVGKITTPEYVVNKSTKLETVFDRIAHVETRFHLIRSHIENRYLRERLSLLERGEADTSAFRALEERQEEELKVLQEELELIRTCNRQIEFLSEAQLKALQQIADKTYPMDAEEFPYLAPDEFRNLSVRRGNLTSEERRIIEHHVLMTREILKEVPFPKQLARVLEFASGHHEKLDGSGYPLGLAGDSIALQARIIAIADVFEALTAKDRPYKKPLKLSEVIRLLSLMKKDHQIDAEIFRLFIEEKLYEEYARRELLAEQIDID